jgi:hypothetical protein
MAWDEASSSGGGDREGVVYDAETHPRAGVREARPQSRFGLRDHEESNPAHRELSSPGLKRWTMAMTAPQCGQCHRAV